MRERIFLSPPDMGPLERDALLKAFDGGWIAPVGPELDDFERALAALTGWSGAVALSSGTAALHLALLTHGVVPGDHVAVSSFTFVASANAILHAGAVPHLIDSETASWNMSPELLADEFDAAERRGTPLAAVVVVDLYGQCADYTALTELCRIRGVPLIQDAAEALGSTHLGRPAGTQGDVGVFSFNGNKVMTTSGGGALVTPDPDIAARVRHLSTQAREPAAHYEHREVGFNHRLSNLLAALGCAQLTRLPAMIERRREINRIYRALLGATGDIELMPIAPWGEWNGWLTCVTFSDADLRESVRSALAADDIESRPLWKPMHVQPLFADAPASVDGTSARLFERGLCLPSGSVMSDGDVERVVAVVVDVLNSRRGTRAS